VRRIRDSIFGTVAALLASGITVLGFTAFADPPDGQSIETPAYGQWVLRNHRLVHIAGPAGIDVTSEPVVVNGKLVTAGVVMAGRREVVLMTPDFVARVPETTMQVEVIASVEAAAGSYGLPGPGDPVIVQPVGRLIRVLDRERDPVVTETTRPVHSAVRLADNTVWYVRDDAWLCYLKAGARAAVCPTSVPRGPNGELGALILTGNAPLYVDLRGHGAYWATPDGLDDRIELPPELDLSAQVNAWNSSRELVATIPSNGRLFIAEVRRDSLANVRMTDIGPTQRLLPPLPTRDSVVLVGRDTGSVASVAKSAPHHRRDGKPVGARPQATYSSDGLVYVLGDGPTMNVVEPSGVVTALPIDVPAPPPPRGPKVAPPRKDPKTKPAGVAPKLSVPGRPRSLSAAAGDAEVALAWLSSDANGARVLAYEVTWSRIGSGETGSADVAGDATAIRVSGLRNDATYVFHVRARNRVGAGPPAVSDAVTPSAVLPATPVNLTAVPRADGTADVAWGPGDSASVTYDVAVTSAGAVVARRRVAATAVRMGTSDGLALGTPYQFLVTAVGAGGVSSRPSAPTREITLAGPADAPTAVRADPAGDRALRLSWSPPTSRNGGTIRGYEIRRDDGSISSVSGTETTMSGLDNGRSYTFRISAVTDTDVGTIVGRPATVQAVPGGPPIPGSFNARPAGDRTIHVTFNVDENDSGPATCRILLNGSESWRGDCSGSVSVDIGGLSYSADYDVAANAANGYGASADIGHVTVRTNDRPRVVTVSKGDAVNSSTCTASACAWVRVQASGFTPNTSLSVRCYSTTDSSGWYTYQLRTDANGNADSGTSTGCYYGFSGMDVWVIASGVESNHLRW
jgi:hypothetical protein